MAPEGKDASAELYTWWNRYVQTFRTNLTVAHSSPGGSSQGLPHLERHHLLPQRGGLLLQSYKNNTEHAEHPCPPSFRSSSGCVHLVDTNITVRKTSDMMREQRDPRNPHPRSPPTRVI